MTMKKIVIYQKNKKGMRLIMINNLEVLIHSSIKIKGNRKIYIDPFKIDKNYLDADIIMITHDHFDHYSEEDIEKIKKENTTIVIPEKLLIKVEESGFKKEKIMVVEPNKKYEIDGIKIETIPAYNTNKQFHPKEMGWVGYILEINGIHYYIAGDTDITEENKKVKCDVALVPIGGTYTMTYSEAANLINIINPKIAIPIHYGSIVGTNEDAKNFVKLLKPNIKGEIIMKR